VPIGGGIELFNLIITSYLVRKLMIV